MSVLGFGALGEYSDGDGGGPESVASPIAVLAANPDTLPIYLVIASPYDPDTASIVDRYYSTAAFTSASTDTPANQPFTENRISVALVLSNDLALERGSLRATGTTGGDIVFWTGTPGDRVDELASYLWDGRGIRVLIGFDGYTLAQFSEVFTGTAEGAEWGARLIRISLRSARFRLEREIQTNLYTGLTTITDTGISFTATDTIGSATQDVSVFTVGMMIEVAGSASNNGFYVVGSSTTTTITLSAGSVVNESAGATVTIRSALEGGTELTGKCKPLAWGQRRQLLPVLVNGIYLIYQVHDGSIQAINVVRDRGADLTFDSDYASGRLLAAATVSAGQYATCLAEGLFRLGASSSGIVTCDLQGDKSGTLGSSGYTSTAADIVRKIVTTQGDFTDPDELETGSFDDLNTAQSSVVGAGTGLQARSIADVVDEIADSVGAFIDFPHNGRMRIVRLVDPSTATAKDTITSVEELSLKGKNADIPAHTIRLQYKPYGQTLTGEEAATALDDDVRNDYAQAFRVTTQPDSSILTLHPSAVVYHVSTQLDDSTAAANEAIRRLALYKKTRHVYKVEAWQKLFAYDLGDVVSLQLSRYDLAAGKNFVVVGIREAPRRSDAIVHENIATLTLWGREN